MLVISLPVIRTLSSNPRSSYQRPRHPHGSLCLCYICGPYSPSRMLLAGDQSPPLLDLSYCYRLSSPSWVSQHSHIRAEDLPSAATPAALWAGHVSASCLCCYLWAPGRLWTIFPHSSVDLGRLTLGVTDVLTYLLFQGRCLRG